MAPKPKPGDLIEIPRGTYQHWALYVGDGDVIHLTTVSDDPKAVLCSASPVGQDKGKVKRQKLEDVAGKDDHSINNLLDDHYEPHPIEDILNKAQSLVGETVQYNVLKNNCEHFATLLRYGKPESQQAQQVEEGANTTMMKTVKTAGAVAIWYYIPDGSIPSVHLGEFIMNWAALGISFMTATKKK